MSADWPIVRLGDHIDTSLGKMLDKKKNKGFEHPYLGNSDVRWGYFDLSNLSKMKFEDSECERYGIRKGDLIICEGGEPGRSAIWNEEVPNMKIQKALHRVRPKKTLHNYYLYYWFLFSGSRGLLEPYFTGTTIKHLTGKALKELKIQLPPLEYQKNVAKILMSLDEKIQLNRQTNQTLEAIAQAIFKSWFVDFDPTRAKIAANECAQALANGASTEELIAQLLEDGRWTKKQAQTIAQGDPELAAMSAISGQFVSAVASKGDETHEQDPELTPGKLKELRETAALFPSVLVDSELGEIPEGWCPSDLGSFIKFANGKATKSKEEGEYPVYGANGIIGKSDTARFYNAVIVGRVGAYCGAVSYSLGSFWASDNTIVASSISGNEILPYIFYQLQILDLNQYAGGAAQPLLNQTTLKSVEVVFSSNELISKFNRLISRFLAASTSNVKQVESLGELRDGLLPKLLSGELSI